MQIEQKSKFLSNIFFRRILIFIILVEPLMEFGNRSHQRQNITLSLQCAKTFSLSHSPSGQPQPPNKEKISPPSGYALETAIANGRRVKETQKFGKEILQLLLLLWLVVSIYFVFHVPSHQEFLFKQRETRLVVPNFESQ